MIKCPYSELELKLALMTMDNKFLDKEFDKKLHKKLAKALAPFKRSFLERLFGFNSREKCIAKYYGISVKELIHSPNYEKLKTSYDSAKVDALKSALMQEGFSDKESWAFILVFFNKIYMD